MTISAVISPVIKRSLLNSVIGGWNGFISDVLGAMFSFTNNEYSTTVPGGQSRTFLETHVYTGAPKLTLKSDGLLGWNRHNWLKNSQMVSAFTAAGSTPPTVAGNVSYLDETCNTVQFTSAMTPGFAGSRATGSSYASSSLGITPSCGSIALSLSRALTGSEALEFYLTGSGTGTIVTVNSTNSAQYVGTFVRLSLPLNSTGTYSPAVQLSGAISGSAVTLYICKGQLNYGSTAQSYLENPSTTSPRLDEPTIFNTSGTRLGILLEPAATNQNTQSADQTNAAWTKDAGSGASGGVGPYSNNMTTFTENTATTVHRIYSTAWSGTGGTNYTISCWLRAGTRRYVAVGFSTGVNEVFVTIDTSNWTISQQATAAGTSTAVANSGKIEDWGGGLYRVSVTGSHVATASYFTVIAGSATATPASPLTTTTYLGDSSTIICSDFQAEAGSVATSYIPTTTASVTRTADTCYRVRGPEVSNYISSGSFLCKVAFNELGSGRYTVASNNDAGWLLYYESDIRAYDSTSLTSIGSTPSVGVQTRFGVSWTGSTMRGANQNNPGTNYTGSFDGAMGTEGVMRIGARTGSSDYLNGTIARIVALNAALSADNLQSWVTSETYTAQAGFDFNYATGVYTYTPVNAGTTTTYNLSTLISSGLMTLTGSAKWVRGSNGLLTQVSAGSLAIEYDATGAVLGCINTEPARTNLCLQSDNQTAAPWTGLNVNSVVTANQAVGPYGTSTLTFLRDNATAAVTHSIQIPSSTTTVQSYVLSCFARVGPGSRHIMLYGLNMDSRGVGFNLTNGTTFTVSGVSLPTLAYGIENWGGGLYRCYAGFTGTARTGNNGAIYLINGTSVTYDGDDTSGAYVGSVQLEAGSYPSSYIPTTTAAVTRNADVWTLNLGSWFDNSKFILAVKAYGARSDMRDGTTSGAVASIEQSGTATNCIRLYRGASSWALDESGGAAASVVNSSPATRRLGVGKSPAQFFASMDGATVAATGTPLALPLPFTVMGVGRQISGSSILPTNFYIQNIQILPIVPTQANVNQYAGSA